MTEVRLTCGKDIWGSPVTSWAADHLRHTLTSRGIRVLDGAPSVGNELNVTVSFADGSDQAGTLGEESFAFGREDDSHLTLVGGDARGLAYGLLELADIAQNSESPADALRQTAAGTHAPATPVRGILRTLTSDVQDLSWFHDRDFWDEYLTHLATHRINRFHLALGMQYNYSHDPDAQDNYLAFAYPFLVAPDGFDVRPEGVSDSERQRNLASLQYIGEAAHRRGIHFQLGLWNHAYTYQESPRERYPIRGLTTPQQHAGYCRAALRELLTQVPTIDGLTVRVHYEGGVHEPSHEFWEVVLQGIREAGRPVELDMHSKGVDQNIIESARKTQSPFIISAKYWAEHLGLPYHQAAVREMENARPERLGLSGVTRGARRFTRYGYGDFLREDRDFGFLFRIWPGTQRVLLWGDPAQVAGIARATASVGGLGVELCEPLSFLGRKTTGSYGGRQPYASPEFQTTGDPWKKYDYTYRLWGRLLYDPEHDPDAWRRYLDRVHGQAGRHLETALAAASRVLPLVTTYHSPSASNNFYWPEMYVNMPLANSARTDIYAFDTPEPGTVGAVSPFDPEMFAPIDSFVEEWLAGRLSGRYTPTEVAAWLDESVRTADRELAAAVATTAAQTPEFRRTALDIAVSARLGTFYAEKTRAGVAYSLYVRTACAAHLRDAVTHYRSARDAFAAVVDLTAGVYVGDLAFGDRPSERGHWADRLPAIDQDLEELVAELAAAPSDGGADDRKAPGVPGHRPEATIDVAAAFVPGESIPVRITLPPEVDGRVELHYRHLNQGTQWTASPMEANGSGFTSEVPSSYTESPYPMQLYATVHDAHGDAWIVPGFDSSLTNEPYLVLHQRAVPTDGNA